MEKKFIVTKEQRKALVAAVGEFIERKPEYQGAPSFAFVVGDFTIDRSGALIYNENTDAGVVDGLLTSLTERGFVFEGGIDGAATAADDGTKCEAISAEKQDGGKLSIDMPISGFTASSLANLENLITAKSWIIKKMTGAEELPVERDTERLSFPWFRADASAAEIDAYTHLIAGLCKTAKEKQRIAATERQLADGDNEKFKARCFLLSLNFIGDEYKQARKILLASMSGNGSHKSGDHKRKEAVTANNPIGSAAPSLCRDCLHHCYYTDGELRSASGVVLDTSKRTPEKYTHYCLSTPSGFRRLKSAGDWSGMETPPKWCPLSVQDGDNKAEATAVRKDDSSADKAAAGGGSGIFHDCLACANSMSEEAENEGEFDKLFCINKDITIQK